MKKLTFTLSLICCLFAATAFCADALSSSSADMAAKAQSLKNDAEKQLDKIGSSPAKIATDTGHVMALQAQKTAADIAIKAHATAAEWTEHASVLAQSAQKLDPTASLTTSTSAQPSPALAMTGSMSKTKSK